MLRRFMERVVAAGDPLAAMQATAVDLQDTYGAWPRFFFEELSPQQIAEAAGNPLLAKAEALYRHILLEGRNDLPPGALGVTSFKLGLLLHRQGRLSEARQVYEDAVRICRLQPEETETQEWALNRSLFRLAEIIIRQDRRRGAELFAEAQGLAAKRRDSNCIEASNQAVRFFSLSASSATSAGARADEDAQAVTAFLSDASGHKPRPVATSALIIVLVLCCAAGAVVLMARILGSVWLGLFAGYCVATVLAPVFSAASADHKGRMVRVYIKAVITAVVAAGLIQYVIRIPWLATAVGLLAVPIAAKRAYEVRSRTVLCEVSNGTRTSDHAPRFRR